MMPPNLISWLLFLAFIVAMIALDLGMLHRRPKSTGMASALRWTALWISFALCFAVLLYFYGPRMANAPGVSGPTLSLEFLTGYTIEESLSVDNLFVFLLLFRYFQVPDELQRKVLFWGILGAILMRGIFIATGVVLLNQFHWVIYLFGAFLLYAGARLFFQRHDAVPHADNIVTRLAQRHLRFTSGFEGGRFTLYRDGRFFFTRLALVLLVIETTDIVFAVDSIPAVLAVTRQPYIVFTSNIFAILGLRALYFALAGLMERFHLLHYGLAIILAFIGLKMLASHLVAIPTEAALGFVLAVLTTSVALSLAFPARHTTLSS
jgi:tellurite resistance protein TerC